MTQLDVIHKFTASLDKSSKSGTAALDEAVYSASSGKFKTWSALVTSFVNDVKNYGGNGSTDYMTLDTKTSNFLKNYCGINLSNSDTGAITGYDAKISSTQISANDIVPENTSVTATYPTESRTTYNGLTVIWPKKNNLTEKQQEIIAALYTWWFQSALDLVEESTGLSYKNSGVNSRTMTISFINRNSTVLASANNSNLTINSTAWDSVDIYGAENSGKRSRGSLADRIIAHELTHAVMCANVTETLWDNDLVATSEGLAELTHGADDGRKYEIINLAQSVNSDRLEKALYYTYDSSEDYYDSYAAGYMILKYLAFQSAVDEFEGTAQVDLSKATSAGYFYTSATGSGNASTSFKFYSSTGTKVGIVYQRSTFKSYRSELSLPESISANGSSEDWSIKGSSADDTIISGNGNDTFTGGEGKDYFVYNNGNDVITDYSEGQDTIVMKSPIKSSKVSGNNVIIYTNNGSLTIRNGKNKSITVKLSNGKTTSQVYGVLNGLTYDSNYTAVTLSSSFNGTLQATDYYSTVRNISASNLNKSVYIFGNNKANSIFGSRSNDTILAGSGNDIINGGNGNDYLNGEYGNDTILAGSGNDTIFGGKGNDLLTGGAGADLFIYASGDNNDTISDFSSSDSISLNNSYSTIQSGKNIILKSGTGSITLLNAKGKSLNIKSSFKNYQPSSSQTKTLTNTDDSTFNISGVYKAVDASSRTQSVYIVGNSYANTIVGGKGDDSIRGNRNHDLLTGGAGADLFIYAFGDGNDTITDYSSSDKISLSSDTWSTVQSGNDVKITANTGSITLLNAKSKKLNIITPTTKNFCEDYWFIEDNFTNSIIIDKEANISPTTDKESDINESWNRHWVNNNQISSNGQ